MARRWRGSDPGWLAEQARLFLDAHQRLEALASEAGLRPADVVIHDLRRGEFQGFWEDEEIVVVVDEVGEALHPKA